MNEIPTTMMKLEAVRPQSLALTQRDPCRFEALSSRAVYRLISGFLYLKYSEKPLN